MTPEKDQLIILVCVAAMVLLAGVFFVGEWKKNRRARRGLYYPKDKLRNL